MKNHYGDLSIPARILDRTRNTIMFEIGDSIANAWTGYLGVTLNMPIRGFTVYPNFGAPTGLADNGGGLPDISSTAHVSLQLADPNNVQGGGVVNSYLGLSGMGIANGIWREHQIQNGQTIPNNQGAWTFYRLEEYGIVDDTWFSGGRTLNGKAGTTWRFVYYAHPTAPTWLEAFAITFTGNSGLWTSTGTTIDMHNATPQIAYVDLPLPVGDPDSPSGPSMTLNTGAWPTDHTGAGEVVIPIAAKIFNANVTGLEIVNLTVSGSQVGDYLNDGTDSRPTYMPDVYQKQTFDILGPPDVIAVMIGHNGIDPVTTPANLIRLINKYRAWYPSVKFVLLSYYPAPEGSVAYFAAADIKSYAYLFCPAGDGTAFTWTNSTKTLSKTGKFTGYTFTAGDYVWVRGGTGVTAGWYKIASKTSNDAIVLTNSITGGTSPTDVQVNGIGTVYSEVAGTYGAALLAYNAAMITMAATIPGVYFYDLYAAIGGAASGAAFNQLYIGDRIHPQDPNGRIRTACLITGAWSEAAQGYAKAGGGGGIFSSPVFQS